MKIYKKIVNFGWGLLIILPLLLLLVFVFQYLSNMKDISLSFDVETLGQFWRSSLFTLIDSVMDPVIDWFVPFHNFNSGFLYDLIGGSYGEQLESIWFLIYYAEWGILVTFFKLMFNAFGALFTFADKWLDKLGGND